AKRPSREILGCRDNSSRIEHLDAPRTRDSHGFEFFRAHHRAQPAAPGMTIRMTDRCIANQFLARRTDDSCVEGCAEAFAQCSVRSFDRQAPKVLRWLQGGLAVFDHESRWRRTCASENQGIVTALLGRDREM